MNGRRVFAQNLMKPLNQNFQIEQCISYYIKEFVHVMASVTNYKGDVSDLMDQKHSGLINYLFGKDRKKEINKEKFMKLQQDLMDDVLWLEFARYTKDGETISEVDFCKHLLLCANITSKKKKQMVSPESLSLYYFANINSEL